MFDNDKKDKKVKFDKKAKSHQKFCELFKVIKGSENPARKTHNTSEFFSKVYYKKRIAGSSNSGEPDQKSTNRATRLAMLFIGRN